MKKVTISLLGIGMALLVLVPSCSKQLNQTPKYGLNSEVVYSDPNNYINVLGVLFNFTGTVCNI